MEIKKTYKQTKHKLRVFWQGILKIIAIEEQILDRIQRAENAIDRLEKTVTNIEKYGKAET